jgi:predicted DsbA family dithiol-disulfide isomerase
VPDAVVKATYYTDPFCPWCWATEPALRRLQSEYDVELEFVIAGLVREVDDAFARHEVEQTLEASAASGQPADARIWLTNPPKSSYPAGIGFHAVAEQGDPAPFLRRVREAVYTERRRMDRADGLLDAARETGGLDLEKLRVDFGSHAFVERFGADLERARSVPEEHRNDQGRTPLPTLHVRNEDGREAWVTGEWKWEAWRVAALKAGAMPLDGPLPDPEEAVRRFGSITTAEVVTVTGLPAVRVAADLWRLATEFRVTARRVPGGELWTPAG